MTAQFTTTRKPADLTDDILVGDRGGLTAITGEVTQSYAMPGMISVETEHGTVFLDDELPVTVLNGTLLTAPLTPERAAALDPDDTGRIAVLITLDDASLLGCGGIESGELADLVSGTVLDGGNLANFFFNIMGIRNGQVLIAVEGSIEDFLTDADCWDDCAAHDDDCDGFCDHTISHHNACQTIGSNPAYPNGRCFACGHGLNVNKRGCPNLDCDQPGRKIDADGNWTDEA